MGSSVLIIEDDSEIRDMLVDLLTSRLPSLQISEASNGLQGFNLLHQLTPDLIITDLAMPKMNGMELMDLLEIKKIKTPVFIFSGRLEYREIAEAHAQAKFFEKPAHMNEMVQGILEAVKSLEN